MISLLKLRSFCWAPQFVGLCRHPHVSSTCRSSSTVSQSASTARSSARTTNFAACFELFQSAIHRQRCCVSWIRQIVTKSPGGKMQKKPLPLQKMQKKPLPFEEELFAQKKDLILYERKESLFLRYSGALGAWGALITYYCAGVSFWYIPDSIRLSGREEDESFFGRYSGRSALLLGLSIFLPVMGKQTLF